MKKIKIRIKRTKKTLRNKELMYKIIYNIITNLKYIKNIRCFLWIKTLSFSANPADDDNMICFVKKDIGIQKKSS